MVDASDNWIVSTTLEKADGGKRRQIRSYVMRGKNTRAAKRSKQALQDEDGAHSWLVTTPRKVASEMSLFGFETDLLLYQQELIFRAFTVVKPPTPSFQGLPIDQPPDTMFCFGNFTHNPALLHAILYTAQTYRDSLVDQLSIPSALASHHLSQALQHLQLRLQKEGEKVKGAVTDTTLSAVTTLAMAAVYSGDVQAAEWHLKGLRGLVEGRGGMSTLKQGTMLELKARRLDFGLALASGRPLYFAPNAKQGPAAKPTTTCPPELAALTPIPMPVLQSWAELKQIALLANKATRTNSRLPAASLSQLLDNLAPHLLTPTTCSVVSAPELLRLSMLAVLKSIVTP